MLLLFLLITNCCLGGVSKNQEWENSHYFSTAFLNDENRVKKHLLNDGFKPLSLKTRDEISISGLYKQVPVSSKKAVILLCDGFTLQGSNASLGMLFNHLKNPGQTLPALVNTCDILSINPRYSFWPEDFTQRVNRILNVPAQMAFLFKNDFYDIVAALEFIAEHDAGLPLIMFGQCAGAYNIMRALLWLQKNDASLLKKLNVCVVVTDSGWVSPRDAVRTLLSGRAIASKGLRLAAETTIIPLMSSEVDISMALAELNREEIRFLVVTMQEDPVISIDQSNLIHKLIFNSRLITIPGKGHCVSMLKGKHLFANLINDDIKKAINDFWIKNSVIGDTLQNKSEDEYISAHVVDKN